ncbi:hypothetical protein [Rubripirellula obstinata]|nr:hypothetical protein [Rubripirellula obstinata]
MQKVYEQFPEAFPDSGSPRPASGRGAGGEGPSSATYGDLSTVEAEIRAMVKADFADLKEKQIKDLLDPKTWTAQKELLDNAIKLQAAIGENQHDDFNEFEATLKQAIKDADVELDAKQKKQIIAAVSWTNPDAEPVIKKVISRLGASPGSKSNGKPTQPDPTYGTFEYKNQIVQFQPDSDLRDNEDVPLTEGTARGANVDAVNEAYFHKEVAPHVPDAWIDKGKCDAKDGGVGIVGYEIPFNRHFYEYQPPRPLQEIDAELDELSSEIMQMLQEVHS